MLGSGGVHLHFSVVRIDKMFTNPCKLYKLVVSSLCVYTYLLVCVCYDDDHRISRESLGHGLVHVTLESDTEICSI